MIIVIAAMVVGVLIGFLVREKKALLRVVDVLVNAAVYMLLLLLGISVGSNQAIISNLGAIGAKAFALTIAGIAGSIAVGFVFQRLAFREKVNEE